MILTHLAFARNAIPVFYNLFKYLQIIRRFYVKKERIPNFRPVVSEILITKTNSINSWHIQIKFVITMNHSTCFSQLKSFIHVHGIDFINRFTNFNTKILNLFTFIVSFPAFCNNSSQDKIQSSYRKREALFCKDSTLFNDFAPENIQKSGQ